MNLTRLSALMRKEMLQIVRDPRTLALVFIMPILQLVLLGYAATSDVRNIPLVVLDQDKSPASRTLLESFRAADYFRQAFDVNSESELRSLIDSGSARAGIIIPPDYSSQLAAGRPAQVAFIIDGSDPAIAGTTLAAATLIGQARATALSVERLAARGLAVAAAPAIEVRTRVWYNPDLIAAYYMIPAVVGLILQFLTVILTATAIVRERERGTIEQLIVTPLRASELIVGKLAPYVLIAFIDTIEILAGGVLLFGVPINGSLPLLLAALWFVSNLQSGRWPAHFHHHQHAAGSHHCGNFLQLAIHFSFRFHLPGSRHAACAAVCKPCHTAALLPDCGARHCAQGRGHAGTLARGDCAQYFCGGGNYQRGHPL